MVGGILIETNDVDVEDAEYIPTVGILKWWIFESEYPFLLPCLFGAVISANALLWTVCFIHDEHIELAGASNENNPDYSSVVSVDAVDKAMYDTLDTTPNAYSQSLNELSKMAVFDMGQSLNDLAQTFSLRSAASPKPNEFESLLMSNLKKTTKDTQATDTTTSSSNSSPEPTYSIQIV